MPFTYTCPRRTCESTFGDPTSVVEHMRDDHDDPLFSTRDVPIPTFMSQYEAQTGQRGSGDIACRSCALPTRKRDDVWRHVHDDSPACVDPDTLKPYPDNQQQHQPQGEEPMSTTTERIRPSRTKHRAWFAALSDDDKTTVKANVVSMIVEGVEQRDAWDRAYDSDQQPRIAPSAADVAAVEQSASEPLTPAEEAAKAVDPTPKRRSKLASFYGNGKPRRNLSDVAYDFTADMLDGKPRMNAAEFRAWLTANGVAEPDASTWERKLPNGNVVGCKLHAMRKAS